MQTGDMVTIRFGKYDGVLAELLECVVSGGSREWEVLRANGSKGLYYEQELEPVPFPSTQRSPGTDAPPAQRDVPHFEAPANDAAHQLVPLPLVTLKPTNPKDRAATDRLDLTLFPDAAKVYGAIALQEGDFKYGGYNWRDAGVKASVYRAALDRHMAKYWNGEWADPGTGVPHLANAIACLAVLIDSHEQGNLTDDRPPEQAISGLLQRAEAHVRELRSKFHTQQSPPRHVRKTTP